MMTMKMKIQHGSKAPRLARQKLKCKCGSLEHKYTSHHMCASIILRQQRDEFFSPSYVYVQYYQMY